MAGTHDDPARVIHVIDAYSNDSLDGTVNGGVVASQILRRWVATFHCRIGAVKVNGGAAGTGGGNTVMDVQINGTSCWLASGNRPTLAATSTGEFTNTAADNRVVKFGDVVTINCISISTTGHQQLAATVDLLDPATIPMPTRRA